MRLAFAEGIDNAAESAYGACPTTLAPEDSALIQRAIGHALQILYDQAGREPLPEGFKALLEQLAAKEAASLHR